MKLTPSNGSHRPEPYFEWWYFHFVTEEGATLNMVLHETDIFGLRQEPYLSLSVLLPGQAPRYLRRGLNNAVVARGQPYLQVGEGLIVESAGSICFDVPFAGRGSFRGTITKLAPPLVIGDGILYQEITGGRTSHWLVQVPHATFTGILHLDGSIHRLRGTAYQDHQWGTIFVQEFVSDWVWGHFSNKQAAVTFFQLLTHSGRLIERIAMLTSGGTFSGASLETTHFQRLFAALAPERFSGNVSLSFFEGQAQVSFTIDREQTMRRRIGEQQGHSVASYLRWASAAEWRTAKSPQRLSGVTEYLRVRLTPNGGIRHQ